MHTLHPLQQQTHQTNTLYFPRHIILIQRFFQSIPSLNLSLLAQEKQTAQTVTIKITRERERERQHPQLFNTTIIQFQNLKPQ